jgi:anaerobic selenocysteine-containing dehydrogenase
MCIFWTRIEEQRRRGLKNRGDRPRRSRTAERADCISRSRIGTDAALALGVMQILVR